jgi:hypothetical protein
MNKLLNDTLRVKGYKGPYYTDTIKTISSIKKEVKLLTDNVAKESTGLKETVKVGENFGKLGIYVGDEHPELKINWAATNNKRGSHALERLTERNISKLDVEYYVENGKVLKTIWKKLCFCYRKGNGYIK